MPDPAGTLRVLVVGPLAPPEGGMATSLAGLLHHLPGQAVRIAVLRTNPRIGFLAHIPVLRSVLTFALFVAGFIVSAPRQRVIHLLGASNAYFWLRCVPVLLLGKFFGRRVILQYKGGLLDEFLSSRAPLKCRLMQRATSITVPSAFLARILARHGLDAVVIPNIAETTQFRWKTRTSFAPRLLAARSLETLYGLDTVLEAFALLRAEFPAATLAIAGDGTQRKALETRAAAIGGVVFHGALGRSALAQLHAESDIFVNASRADNMPVSLMEAMASGLAIVSTSAGGIPDLIAAEAEALLVPVDDAVALHAALRGAITEQDATATRARAAHARIAACGPDAVRTQLLNLYRA